MVEFTDITLRETDGHYDQVCELMKQDGAGQSWMLQSRVVVNTNTIAGMFIINFWHDGRVIIDELLRPSSLDLPNDDIGELKTWADEHGWEQPEPAKKLLDSPRMFDFWERQYQSGFIKCSTIEEKEQNILDKISKSEDKESE